MALQERNQPPTDVVQSTRLSLGRGDFANTGKESLVTPDLISIPDTARRIGLHADTLYRLCRKGQFPPAIQIGSRWRVSVPRLERYLHSDATGDA